MASKGFETRSNHIEINNRIIEEIQRLTYSQKEQALKAMQDIKENFPEF